MPRVGVNIIGTMTDFTDDIFRSTPDRLARLMQMPCEEVGPPDLEELAAAWQRLRSATIEPCPVTAGALSERACPTRSGNSGSSVAGWTFGSLLSDPMPPPDLLVQVKDFAKINREHSDSAFPREIATMLYYASIAVALVRRGERITSLDDSGLRAGLAWASDQSWADQATRRIAEQASKLLGHEP